MSRRQLLPLIAVVAVVAVVASCAAPPPPPPPSAPVAPAPPPHAILINKVWRVSAPAGKPLGSMYVFLPDGTLLMTSCVETYRLAKWTGNADGTLTITEDTAVSYPASYQATERTATLTFTLKTEKMSVDLRVADAPFVCPDLRK